MSTQGHFPRVPYLQTPGIHLGCLLMIQMRLQSQTPGIDTATLLMSCKGNASKLQTPPKTLQLLFHSIILCMTLPCVQAPLAGVCLIL